MEKTVAPSFHPVGQALYDATNDAARKQYWDNVNAALFSQGVDAWWLDTDEPETEAKRRQFAGESHAGGGVGGAVCECVSAVPCGRGVAKGSRRRRTRSGCSSCRARRMRGRSDMA